MWLQMQGSGWKAEVLKQGTSWPGHAGGAAPQRVRAAKRRRPSSRRQRGAWHAASECGAMHADRGRQAAVDGRHGIRSLSVQLRSWRPPVQLNDARRGLRPGKPSSQRQPGQPDTVR